MCSVARYVQCCVSLFNACRVDVLTTPLPVVYGTSAVNDGAGFVNGKPPPVSTNLAAAVAASNAALPWRPHVLLAYLKHCWLHVDRREALARCGFVCVCGGGGA